MGTTFTAAAALSLGDGYSAEVPSVIGLGNRALQIPSVLYLQEDGSFLVGEAAERRGQIDPSRVVREFKRRLGDPVPLIVGGTPVSAQVLSARLLSWVVAAAVERRGAEPDEIVLTHPANWGPYRREFFDQIIRLADIGGAWTCPEPQAAAIQYAAEARLDRGSRVLVYDLGGGTFDVCVLEKTAGGFTILGTPEGIEHLGGIDFDEAIFRHVLESLGDIDLDAPDAQPGLTRLRRDCVEAKEALSVDVDTLIPVTLPGRTTSVRLTRPELEALIEPALSDTMESTARALRTAGTTPSRLTAIVLVGGSSRIPLVSHLLQSRFATPTALDTHPKHAIPLGAVLYTPPVSRPRPADKPTINIPAVAEPLSPPPTSDANAPVPTPAITPQPDSAVTAPKPRGGGEPTAPIPTPATTASGSAPGAIASTPAPGSAAPTAQPADAAALGPAAGDGVGSTGSRTAASSSAEAGGGGSGDLPGMSGGGRSGDLLQESAGAARGGGRVAAGGAAYGKWVVGGVVGVVVVVVAVVAVVLGNRDDPAGDARQGPPSSPGVVTSSASVVPGGSAGLFGVAVSANNRQLFVSHLGARTLSVIDELTGHVDATVPVGDRPLGVAVSGISGDVYVANYGSDTVTRIDGSTLKAVEAIKVGDQPQSIVVQPGTETAYVTNVADGTVSVLDLSENKVVKTIAVGKQPLNLATDSTGRRVYVANAGSNTVTVISTSSRRVIETIELDKPPHDVAVSPDSKLLYVTSKSSSEIVVVDASSGQRQSAIATGAVAEDLVVVANRLYATLQQAGRVAVINTTTQQLTSDQIRIDQPAGIALNPDGTRLYVTSNRTGSLTTIDTATNQALGDPIAVPTPN